MARIQIETEDPVLSAVLLTAIADTMIAHGFHNVRAKVEMVGISPGRPPILYPPELMGLEYVTDPAGALSPDLIARHPEMLGKPIVLTAGKTTSPKYVLAESKFLAAQ